MVMRRSSVPKAMIEGLIARSSHLRTKRDLCGRRALRISTKRLAWIPSSNANRFAVHFYPTRSARATDWSFDLCWFQNQLRYFGNARKRRDFAINIARHQNPAIRDEAEHPIKHQRVKSRGRTRAALAFQFGLSAFLALSLTLPFPEALPATPRLKPTPRIEYSGLAILESRRLQQGFADATAGNWSQVREAAQITRDPIAQKLLQWRILIDDKSAPSFSELQRGLNAFADWPRAQAIRARAEQSALFALSAQEAERFLVESGPRNDVGRASLALVMQKLGKSDRAIALARGIWRSSPLDQLTQSRLLSAFAQDLTPEDHQIRFELLLWLDRLDAARALLPRLTSHEREIAYAWIALRTNAKNALTLFANLSAEDGTRPGLLFERARRARKAEKIDAAIDLMRNVKAQDVPLAARDDVWAERRLLILSAIKENRLTDAYAIAKEHGLSSGENFADGEFLSGWFALRGLKDPELAAQHFATLEQGVRTAVSLSRARFWRARALAAAGKAEESQNYYRLAAQFPTTFYGQLAIVRGQIADALDLPLVATPTPEETMLFNARDSVRAIRILSEMGESELARLFFLTLDDQLENAQEHSLLSSLALEMGLPDLAVRTAKSGLARGLISPVAAYPIPALPREIRDGAFVEPALVLAISRQETEFDPQAISGANARGLMQLLPSVAAAEARRLGLDYRLAWLTDDPDYNLRLGSSHLGALVDQLNGSYIMAAAAYNAGTSRAVQWAQTYGDPRQGGIDPVDWIESIPFGETRNYVQRVLENVQVYRARLSSAPVPLDIERDLNRGRRG